MSPLLSYFIYLFTFVYLKVTNCPFLSLYLSVCICLTLSLSVLMSLSLGLFMSLSIWAIVSFFSCQSSFSYLSISFYCLFLYVAIVSLFVVNLVGSSLCLFLLLLRLYLMSILIGSSLCLFYCYCIFICCQSWFGILFFSICVAIVSFCICQSLLALKRSRFLFFFLMPLQHPDIF